MRNMWDGRLHSVHIRVGWTPDRSHRVIYIDGFEEGKDFVNVARVHCKEIEVDLADVLHLKLMAPNG